MNPTPEVTKKPNRTRKQAKVQFSPMVGRKASEFPSQECQQELFELMETLTEVEKTVVTKVLFASAFQREGYGKAARYVRALLRNQPQPVSL